MRIRPLPTSATYFILAALKAHFKACNIRYRDIANMLQVSEITVKRYLTGRGLTVKSLEQLAQVSDLTLFELLELARSQTKKSSVSMGALSSAIPGAEQHVSSIDSALISRAYKGAV
jgi:hypothetical protein